VVYEPIRKTEFNHRHFKELIGYELADFVKLKALTGDKSDNIPGIKGFGKVKISKFLNGEYMLSEAEEKHFNDNLKLVDLSLTLNDRDEVNYVKDQFDVKPELNYEKFKHKCEELKFHQILKNIDSWYSIFFMKSKLNDLLCF
jgi:5'-3' exonuclease